MKEIYVLLSYTGTWFSRLIRVFTHSKYTHASIALDENCTDLFGFSRRTLRPYPAGFMKEDLKKGVFGKNPKSKCAMFRARVDNETYAKIREELLRMYAHKDFFSYNYVSPFLCFFRIPHHSGAKYFCSEFVAEILDKNGIITLEKPASLVKPKDLARYNDLTLVYTGTIGDLERRSRMAQVVDLDAYTRPASIRKTAAL